MGQITKVTPDMIQVANNVTSTTIGNTTSGVSLTFDSNGVITSAANVVLSVANTQLTGTITNAQLGTNAVSNTKIAAGAVEQYFADTGFEAQFRNRIINGDMRIDQRRAGAAVTVTDAYTLDRWELREDSDGAISVQQVTDAPTGFVNSLKITTTTADASLTTTQRLFIRQPIEGNNVADLAWGTASAKTVTLSFWVKSSLTGTFSVAFVNSGTNRSYTSTYTINAADTWEYKTVTVAGDTSGTWLTTNGIGIVTYFSLGVGPDYTGTPNEWVSSLRISATGSTSVIGTLNATWQVTGVQLEVGSVATPFERRPYGLELMLCQRYYWVYTGASNGEYLSTLQAYGTTAIYGFLVSIPVSMRATPSVSQSGTFGAYQANSNNANMSTTIGSLTAARQGIFSAGWGGGSGLVAGNASVCYIDNGAKLIASAEL